MERIDLFPDIPIVHAPAMPKEYFGEIGKPCGYTRTNPRKWTEKEIEWIEDLKAQGWSIAEIANSVQRSEISISIKLKRISKRDYAYNKDHCDDKYATNAEFMRRIKPDTVLDIYAGLHSWYKDNSNCNVCTNDINPNSDTDYHEKSEMLIHKLYYERCKYDLIDLDPFGSAYECFDLAIKMARKAIVITYGEIGHRRFKRLDYVRRFYGIDAMEDFTIDRLIAETQRIAERNKKVLKPIFIRNWNRISRVYYEIEDMKITEQWR